MGILDLIFPKKCVNCKKIGEYVCVDCFIWLSFTTRPICLVCKKPSLNNLTHKECLSRYSIDGCFSALAANKLSFKLLSRFKSKPYLSNLTKFLSELFYESLIQNEGFMKLLNKGNLLMISVPVSKEKLRKRGYNQSELLAKALSLKLQIPYYNSLLLKDKYEIKSKTVIGKNILVVDDIVKSGLTLQNIARVLKRGGGRKVFGLTLIGRK